MFLSGGGAYAHVDARRTSVAGALDWALQAGLQGLVLEAGAVQAQPAAVASARSKGLLVRAGLVTCRERKDELKDLLVGVSCMAALFESSWYHGDERLKTLCNPLRCTVCLASGTASGMRWRASKSAP